MRASPRDGGIRRALQRATEKTYLSQLAAAQVQPNLKMRIAEATGVRWRGYPNPPILEGRFNSGGGDGDHGRMSLRRGAVHDRGRRAARRAPVLVPRLPVPRGRKRNGQCDLPQGRADRG